MKRTSLLAALLSAALILPAAQATETAQPAAAAKSTKPTKTAKTAKTTKVAQPVAEAAPQEKVVYHINDASVARVAMRNIENHLNASPGVKIVVVTHGKGIDFLLNDAKDEKGAFAPQVAGLKERGVVFDVCRNTLTGRKLGDDAVIMEAQVVPSGVAEIGKLQAREGYVYLKP